MREDIITIRNKSLEKANNLFAEFMLAVESSLNNKSILYSQYYSKCSSKELEQIVVDEMKEISTDYHIRSNEIRLVSGQNFPDIIVETYYGVEVKSTQSKHWISTGSSIIESTRDKDVETIWMLFGKLGSNPPEFKCRPYEDCLCDIGVTHSPRYHINMLLSKDETIFSKMKITYDQLRKSNNSITLVRNYYREKAINENKKEMPWWLSSPNDQTEENFSPINISLWFDKGKYADSDRNKRLKAEVFILFPEVVEGNYENAALWLCTHRSIINFHMRDTFSAGGQQQKLNDKPLSFPLPHVIGELLDSAQLIKTLLLNNNSLESDILEFRPDLISQNQYEIWFNDILNRINLLKPHGMNKTIGQLGSIPLKDWIDNECVLSVK